MSRRSLVACAACAGLLASATNVAAFPRAAASAEVSLEAVGYDQSEQGELAAHAMPGLDVTALIAPDSLPIAYAAGFGYRFGLTLPAGFAYDATLAPIGVGALIDGLGYFVIQGGGGLSGVTERAALSFELSTRARLFVSLPGSLALAAGLELAWLDAEARRGESVLGLGDEARATLGLRIGDERERYDFELGSGLLVALVGYDWLGQRGAGLAIGWSIDALPAASAR